MGEVSTDGVIADVHTPTHQGEFVGAIDQAHGEDWSLYRGDSCELVKGLPDNSVDFGIHSPPFCSLYIYSDSVADMGNCASNDEFFAHYGVLIRELYRTTAVGRLCAVHCKDLPRYANRDGTAGLIDFPGMCISAFEREGWSYHSRVTIWKCPVTERERTNNNGLLHKTVTRDRTQLRMGMADYLIVMRKAPTGTLMADKPVVSPDGSGFTSYAGDPENDPRTTSHHPSPYARKSHHATDSSIDIWRRYAEPVWWDVDQTDVLNKKRTSKDRARDTDDERHICVARGSLVLTRRGHVPIESVEVGDQVLTHLGRWRPVTAKVCNGVRPVVQTKAHGVPYLLTTPDHELWMRRVGGSHPTRHRKVASSASPEWVRADEGKANYVNLPLPPVEDSEFTDKEWWLAGYWLGNGHYDTRNGLHVSCDYSDTAGISAKIGERAGFVADTGTSNQIRLHDADGRMRKLLSGFGRGASGKRLPVEALSLNPQLAECLLSGYLAADGHYVARHKRWMGSSVSRALLLGMAMLAQRVKGVVASVYAGRPPGTATIQGRKVNTKQDWILGFASKNLSGFIQDDGAWKKVRSVESAGEAEVWDITVADDASFVVEGAVAHNCPLQLCLIERAVEIWSNPGEVVLSPFAGIGSEGVGALRRGRRFVGCELKDTYFAEACRNLATAESAKRQERLF